MKTFDSVIILCTILCHFNPFYRSIYYDSDQTDTSWKPMKSAYNFIAIFGLARVNLTPHGNYVKIALISWHLKFIYSLNSLVMATN